MKNLKDRLTTICGILILIFGAGTGVIWQVGIELPVWLSVSSLAIAGISAAIISYLQGKNADGTTKKPSQLEAQKKAE